MTHRLARSFITGFALLMVAGCATHQVVKKTSRPAPVERSENSKTLHDFRSYPSYSADANQVEEQEAPDADGFPRPRGLEPQVNFWRNVYATWSRSQVAIHDNVHMNLIYETLDLPGETGEGYTEMQKDYIQERFAYWKARLRNLENDLAMGASLSAEEQELAQKIMQSSGDPAAVQGASERLRYQRGLRERFKRGLEISGLYDRQFRTIFREAGLPEDLAYLPHVESSFQAHARSSAGALGIWQFTAGAARRFMNGDDSVSARLNPISSARGAARYLSYAYQKLGSWPLAVTSYNHGIGGMSRAKEQFGSNFHRIVKHYDHPLFGFASRNYYAEFLAARDIARDPNRYFPEGVRYESSFRPILAQVDTEADFARPLQPSSNERLPLRVAQRERLETPRIVRPKAGKATRETSPHSTRSYVRKGKEAPVLAARHAHHDSGNIRSGGKALAMRPAAPRKNAAAKSPRVAPAGNSKPRQLADNRTRAVKVAQKDR